VIAYKSYLEVSKKHLSSFFAAIALNKQQTLLHQC